MTIGAITFDLGSASSPAMMIGDASGLAPLSLPKSFFGFQESPRQPSDDAVCRFESAMSRNASPVSAERPLRILREMSIAPVPAEEVAPIEAKSVETIAPANKVAVLVAPTTAPVAPTVSPSGVHVAAEVPVSSPAPVIAATAAAPQAETVVIERPVHRKAGCRR